MRYWLRLLDSHLPPPFCQVGEWLARADDFIESDEIPTVMNEETATIISRKLEEHKVDYFQISSQVSLLNFKEFLDIRSKSLYIFFLNQNTLFFTNVAKHIANSCI